MNHHQKIAHHFPVRLVIFFLFGSSLITVAVMVFSSVILKRDWSNNLDKNILLINIGSSGSSREILFAHISPSAQKIELVSLNPALPINLLGSSDTFPLAAVLSVWTQQQKQIQYLPAGYTFGLGKIMDEVWVSYNFAWNAAQPNFSQISQQIFLNHIATNLRFGDRFWLYQFVRGLRPDQVQFSQADSIVAWQKATATSVYADIPPDCSVAVINTIGVTGVGTRVGTILQKSGLSVVRISDEQTELPTTQLIEGADAQKCLNQHLHLLNSLPVATKVVKDDVRSAQYRASMVLMIGNDLKPLLK